MNSFLITSSRAATLFAASVAFAGAFVLTATGARGPAFDEMKLLAPSAPVETLAEAFPDARYGVDSMVTGPTSQAFAERQKDLGCAEAEWPKTPIGCYPD